MKEKIFTLFDALKKYVVNQPSLKEIIDDKFIQQQSDVITNNYIISNIAGNEKSDFTIIEFCFKDISVKSVRKLSLGNYIVKIRLYDSNSITIDFYQYTCDNYASKYLTDAEHPHIQKGKACWGSYESQVYNSLYSANFIAGLSGIRRFLCSYNGRSVFVQGKFFERTAYYPTKYQQFKIFGNEYTPRKVLARDIKKMEELGILSITCETATDIWKVRQWTGSWSMTAHKKALLINKVKKIFPKNFPTFACFELVKLYFRHVPRTGNIADGLDYYLKETTRLVGLNAGDKREMYENIYKIFDDLHFIRLAFRKLENATYWQDRLQLSKYSSSIPSLPNSSLYPYRTQHHEIVQELIKHLEFQNNWATSDESLDSIKRLPLWKYTKEIFNAKSIVKVSTKSITDKDAKPFNFDYCKPISPLEMSNILKPIISRHVNLYNAFRKYQLNKIERSLINNLMEVKNEINNQKSGSESNQLSFESI